MKLLPCLLPLLALAPGLVADEVRRTDGTVVIGDARVDGDVVRIRTADGTVVVKRDEVLRIRTDEELEQELAGLREKAGDRAHAWIEIARLARGWQLEESMWSDLDRALAMAEDPRDRARLDEVLADLEPELLPAHRRRGDVDKRVRELLHRARPGVSSAKVAAIEAILAGLDVEGAEDAVRQRAREATNDLQRKVAVRAVARRGAPDGERFVWRTTVFDRDADLRTEIAEQIAQGERRDAAVDYLAAGFTHSDPSVRIHTARTFAVLGGDRAVSHLVAAGPAVPAEALPGGSTRGYAAFLQQQSYIRDFNVEVAQASFIADPVVDVLQSGTVLDVTVHAVVAYRTHILDAYRQALRDLTGEDPGPDPERWSAWLESRS